MRRSLLIAAFAAAALVTAAPAGAVDLPRSQARVSSAQLLNGQLIWFQRNNRYKSAKQGLILSKAGVGALYARALDSKTARRVYLPPAGRKIVAFKAAAGRVILGLASVSDGGRGPSEIVELTPSDGLPWHSTSIASALDAIAGEQCGSRVELIGIRANADAIVQSVDLDGRGANCALTRQSATVTAYPKAGDPVQLGERTSGWSAGSHWNSLYTLFPTAGDWLVQSTGTGFGGWTPVALWNTAGGERKLFSNSISRSTRTEPTSGGGLLLRIWNDRVLLMPDLADPSKVRTLRRPGARLWAHSCGTRLLEVSRSWRAFPSGKWRLFLRDGEGATLRELREKIPAGSLFDACDQNTAVFHRPRHDGGIHQWAVALQ